jgi:hypothetical protein
MICMHVQLGSERTVNSSHVIHLQLDISANALEIRVLQCLKCIVWRAIDCTCAEQQKGVRGERGWYERQLSILKLRFH